MPRQLRMRAMITAQQEEELQRFFPALRELPQGLRGEVRSKARMAEVPAGAVLFDEGAACRAFPLLVSGLVRVAKTSPEGREIVLYRIAPGEICLLTSSCLLGQAQYPARGVAEMASRLALLDSDCFHRLLSAGEGFQRLVFGLFAERIAELMQLVEVVAFGRLDRRLAALLAERGEAIGISHQRLADELGSVRVVVSRLLKSFEERGWVELGREQIRVADGTALREFAAGLR